MYGLIFIVSMVIYYNIFSGLIEEKKKYENIFKDHKSYLWNFDRARIKSTVNPSYFEDAVSLIKKYSINYNRIYIISQYDSVLPFLAHKISAMPFHDLKWYNMTDKELEKSVTLISSQRPEYVFVDRDINRNYKEEIILSSVPSFGYLHEESEWRAERLSLMAHIFNKVSEEYVLVESGKLLSVYKRK